jgi:hypothetical protein
MRGIGVTVSLLLATGCVVVGCLSAPRHFGDMRFEAEARGVLEPLGVEWSRDPRIVLESSGAIRMLAVSGDPRTPTLALFTSHDGGDRFGPGVPVSPSSSAISSHGENAPALVVHPTALYALWEEHGPEGQGRLRFARSLSFGNRFDPPIGVSDAGVSGFAGFATLGRAPAGEAIAAWLDGRDAPDQPGTFALRIACTIGKGERFEPSVRVAGAACPCCRPAVALSPRGELAIAWRRTFPDRARDVVVSISRDSGRTFEPPLRVATDDWRTEGCPHSGPSAAWTGGGLWVAWTTEGEARAPGVWLARSRDGGRRFEAAHHASGSVLDANHPALTVAPDSTLRLAFEGRPSGAGERWAGLSVFACAITTGGTVSAPVRVISSPRGSAAYPSIAAGGAGRVFVAWTEARDRSPRVVLGRGRTKL